MNHNIYLINHI